MSRLEISIGKGDTLCCAPSWELIQGQERKHTLKKWGRCGDTFPLRQEGDTTGAVAEYGNEKAERRFRNHGHWNWRWLVGSRQSSSERAGDEQRERDFCSVLYGRSQLPDQLVQKGHPLTRQSTWLRASWTLGELPIAMSLPRAILGKHTLRILQPSTTIQDRQCKCKCAGGEMSSTSQQAARVPSVRTLSRVPKKMSGRMVKCLSPLMVSQTKFHK